MNRSAIEWCDYSWNPITGCTRNCPYCYARRMAYRLKGRYGYPKDKPFTPIFRLDRLLEPYQMKKGQKIFTVSMGDLFDSSIHPIHRDLVLAVMDNCPQHDFIVLTKQIDNAIAYFNENVLYPPNLWLGVSQDGLTTNPRDISKLSENFPHKNTFVSFEPLLGPITVKPRLTIKWVIIGAQTGRRPKQPRKEWVQAIGEECFDFDIPLFVKNNIDMSEDERLQEWPKSMVTEQKQCKRCKTRFHIKEIWSHCTECGYPYDLDESEQPDCWTEPITAEGVK